MQSVHREVHKYTCWRAVHSAVHLRCTHNLTSRYTFPGRLRYLIIVITSLSYDTSFRHAPYLFSCCPGSANILAKENSFISFLCLCLYIFGKNCIRRREGGREGGRQGRKGGAMSAVGRGHTCDRGRCAYPGEYDAYTMHTYPFFRCDGRPSAQRGAPDINADCLCTCTAPACRSVKRSGFSLRNICSSGLILF